MNLQHNNTERVRISENFHLDEFVDPHTYFSRADKGKGLMDPRVFDIVQLLLEKYGKPLGINNWWANMRNYKGNSLEFLQACEAARFFVWSGYRSPICTIGAKNGAHYSGQAADPKGPGKFLFDIVKKNAEEFYNIGLRRLEDPKITPTWLHVDTLERNTQPNSIRVVDLRKATEIIRW